MHYIATVKPSSRLRAQTHLAGNRQSHERDVIMNAMSKIGFAHNRRELVSGKCASFKIHPERHNPVLCVTITNVAAKVATAPNNRHNRSAEIENKCVWSGNDCMLRNGRAQLNWQAPVCYAVAGWVIGTLGAYRINTQSRIATATAPRKNSNQNWWYRFRPENRAQDVSR